MHSASTVLAEGNDGPWSSFFLRVGTPEQDVRVLVSTASPESMVVFSNLGCSMSVFETVPPNCAVSRGGLFNPNESASWDQLGLYGINDNGVGLEANLGYVQRAEFGSETVGLGLTGPVLDNQTVAGIASAYPFYLGIFGLNGQPVNLTSLSNYTSPSFLTTLKDQNIIPSLSWSYTAGARYRLKQVYGQLILSGYDTSRFTENSVSFTMAGDSTRDLVVALQSISYSGSTSAVLLSDPIHIFIDSTDPNLWLPDSVCDAFENAFGLIVDNATGMYLVNDTQHTLLLNSDAEVTFRLSDVTEGGDAVTIVLPYNAFDLTAEYPLVENTSYYFPLKRAANSTQYTLGRAFLQEAYLSADYERRTFNVSACAWVEGAEENIVTILSKDSDSTSSSASGGSSLSGGAIAGIVIGAVIGALIIGALIALIIRRQRKKAAYTVSDPGPDASVIAGPVHNAPATPGPKYYSPETVGTGTGTDRSNGESNGGSVADQRSQDLNGQSTHTGPDTELDGKQIYQLDGDSAPPANTEPPISPIYYELGGSEVKRTGSHLVPTAGTSASPETREGRHETPSPSVSTMGTEGWQEERGDASSDLVSPTTPVRHRMRASLGPDPAE
ncbi:acid protease [Hypoxylon crocopeplum]|nr:acid protease [Hypoxylon crocopeplum]